MAALIRLDPGLLLKDATSLFHFWRQTTAACEGEQTKATDFSPTCDREGSDNSCKIKAALLGCSQSELQFQWQNNTENQTVRLRQFAAAFKPRMKSCGPLEAGNMSSFKCEHIRCGVTTTSGSGIKESRPSQSEKKKKKIKRCFCVHLNDVWFQHVLKCNLLTLFMKTTFADYSFFLYYLYYCQAEHWEKWNLVSF